MIKPIVHDPVFLGMKSEAATSEDLQVAKDLLDTLVAHKDSCVGMAANMIGEPKRILVFDNGGADNFFDVGIAAVGNEGLSVAEVAGGVIFVIDFFELFVFLFAESQLFFDDFVALEQLNGCPVCGK